MLTKRTIIKGFPFETWLQFLSSDLQPTSERIPVFVRPKRQSYELLDETILEGHNGYYALYNNPSETEPFAYYSLD
jgi:hypothetical protein